MYLNAYIILLISKNSRKVLLDFTRNMWRRKLKTNKVILIFTESMLTREDTLKIMSTISDKCYKRIKMFISKRILELWRKTLPYFKRSMIWEKRFTHWDRNLNKLDKMKIQWDQHRDQTMRCQWEVWVKIQTMEMTFRKNSNSKTFKLLRSRNKSLSLKKWMRWLEIKDLESVNFHPSKLHNKCKWSNSSIKMSDNTRMRKKISTVHYRPNQTTTKEMLKQPFNNKMNHQIENMMNDFLILILIS